MAAAHVIRRLRSEDGWRPAIVHLQTTPIHLHLKSDSVIANIGWLGAAGIVSKPAWFIFIVFTARTLGADGFGLYVYLLALSALISAFFEFGLDIQVVRDISPDKRRISGTGSSSVTLRLIGAAFTFAIGIALFPTLFNGDLDQGIYLMGLAIGVGTFLLNHLKALFRSLELLRFEAFSTLAEKLLVPVIVLPALVGTPDLHRFFLLHTVGTGLTLLLTFGLLLGQPSLRPGRPNFIAMRQLLRQGVPFAVMNLILIAYGRMGTLLLERFSGQMGLVGYLNAGIRLQDAYQLVPGTLMAAVYPVFCRVHDRSRTAWELVDLLTRVLLGIAVPVGATLFIASEQLAVLIFGESYREAHEAIGLYGLTIISLTQVLIIGGLVSAAGLQHRANRLLIVSFILSIALYLLLSDGFTHRTAALLGLLDQTLIWLVNGIIAARFLRGWRYLATFGKAFVFPIIAWIVVSWMESLGMDLQTTLLVPAAVFAWSAVGMAATGVVRIGDIRRVKSLNRLVSEGT